MNNTLFEIFATLGFDLPTTEKMMNELIDLAKNQTYVEMLKEVGVTDFENLNVEEANTKITSAFTQEQISEKTNKNLETVMDEYMKNMVEKLSPEQKEKIAPLLS